MSQSHPLRQRRRLLRAGMCLGLPALWRPAQACEYFASTLRIVHPWARASAPGATEALVSMTFNDVSRSDRLLRVTTPVAATAELGGAGAGPLSGLLIEAGQETVLAEGGTWLRLVGLLQPLEVARSYPMRLQFEHGGLVNATLNIDFPSGRFL